MTSPASTRSARSLSASVAEYMEVRAATVRIAEPLSPEDCNLQSMPEASPIKWHLAHSTWFFETFVLIPFSPDYRPFDPQFRYLFNSYYNSLGERHPRHQRGLLSRPSLADVMSYRQYVDRHLETLLTTGDEEFRSEIETTVQLGLQHEQQHQELMFTDLKHAFFQNPLRPAYRLVESSSSRQEPVAVDWIDGRAGVHFLGHDAAGFAFDNEGPRHRVYLQPYQLASRLVNNRDYLEFIEDGGYSRPELWLSDGWAACRAAGWTAPLYWERADGDWTTFTLNGVQPLEGNDPVGHLSFYEADAFARWAGARLPTEAEWEVLAADLPVAGNFLENDQLRPTGHGAAAGGKLAQMFGDVWEWTGSPYVAYPGYRPVEGALGEYNGKFMCNQFVLRGGSCVTPRSHIRPTYRNFFPPEARWQFAGLRLARDS